MHVCRYMFVLKCARKEVLIRKYPGVVFGASFARMCVCLFIVRDVVLCNTRVYYLVPMFEWQPTPLISGERSSAETHAAILALCSAFAFCAALQLVRSGLICPQPQSQPSSQML